MAAEASASANTIQEPCFLAWVVGMLADVAVYLWASSYASPRMNALVGFTSLYCVLAYTVRDGLKRKTTKGYVWAGLSVAVLVVAAGLTAFGPLPS